MRDDQHRCLSLLGQLPARLMEEQAAWVLNCQPPDVSVLIVSCLLKPLGNPASNSVRCFASFEVLELAKDRAWQKKSDERRQPTLKVKAYAQVGT